MYIVELKGQYVQSKKKDEVTWTQEIREAKEWKTEVAAAKVADALEANLLEKQPVAEVFRARTKSLAANPKEVRKFTFKDLRTIEDWMFQKEQLPSCIFEIQVQGVWHDINQFT